MSDDQYQPETRARTPHHGATESVCATGSASAISAGHCGRAGTGRASGTQLLIRVRFALLLMLLGSLGCAGEDGPQLPVSKFTPWKLPADGRRIPAPRALYTSHSGKVYALDDAGRVLVYDSEGNVLSTWHMPDHSVGRPEGVVELLDGRIAVADTHYHRVVFFYSDGSVESMMGEKGRDAGQFVYPVAIAQDPSGFIYVGEYGDRQRIQKFTADGDFVTQFGEHGTEPGQFQRPSGIVWSNGTIYTVDAFNNRIQVFSDSGDFRKVLKLPDNSSGLEFPYDIRGTSDGRLYVVENSGCRITVLDQEGAIIGRYGTPGRGEGNFLNPWGLTVMSDGRILVADTGNHRIVELVLN